MFPQQKLHCYKGTVFSTRSVPGCYKQGPYQVSSGSSLNDTFKVVVTIFQQLTEFNGAETEEDRITVIKEIVLKLTKQNGR
jgi:hypothetical protein